MEVPKLSSSVHEFRRRPKNINDRVYWNRVSFGDR